MPNTFLADDSSTNSYLSMLACQEPLSLVGMVRKGLPWEALDSLARATSISQRLIAESLAIPVRTISRRKKEGTLSSEESNKLLRFAKVVARSEEVFGDTEQAVQWLIRENRSLEGKTPLSLLDTDIGSELVLDTLGRLEHGVFS